MLRNPESDFRGPPSNAHPPDISHPYVWGFKFSRKWLQSLISAWFQMLLWPRLGVEGQVAENSQWTRSM